MENLHYILFFNLVFLVFVFIGLYYTRDSWRPILVNFVPSAVYQRLPQTFHEDVEAGLHSESFNLAGNIESSDGRSGLDAKSKKEILKIMKAHHVSFDEARTKFLHKQLAKHNISPDGIPLDPRAVTFS